MKYRRPPYSLLLIILIPVFCFAEPQRGRLSDGRAFRLDANGNEIIDYIAELEVSNDALQTRVYGLESALEEKEAQLIRLKETGASDPVIGEKNLLEESSNDSASWETERETLLASRSELEGKNRALSAEKDLLTRQTNELSAELSKAQKELNALKKVNSQQIEIIKQTKEHSVKNTQESSVPRSSERASMRYGKVDELQLARNSFEDLEVLVAQRDAAFADYARESTALKVEPTEPSSSRGVTIEKARQYLKGSPNSREVSFLQNDINEMRQQIKEDLTLIKRLHSY